MVAGHLYIICGEMSIQVGYPFLRWDVRLLLLSCRIDLYILGIKPYQLFDSPIFSHILLIVSFAAEI